MDVQPPQTAPNGQPNPSPAPEEPVVPAPAQSVETLPSSNETPAQTTPELAAVASDHKPHRMPVIAVVCAVIFTGIFAAVAAMAYMSESGTKTNDTMQQPTTTSASESPATATDVTDTDKAIDDSMSSVNDATDYDDAGVSDTTLGL